MSLKETELQKELYKAYLWKMKEPTGSSEPIELFSADSEGFEEFLEAGMIEKIEVYAKNDVHVQFLDGTVMTMDCSGRKV